MDTFNLQQFFEFVGFDIYDWVLLFAGVFLLLEIADDVLEKRMNKKHFLEIAANMVTQIPYYFAEIFIFGAYVYLGFYIHDMIPWKIPVTISTGILILFLTDFTYYVEHFAAHRVRLFWLAHSVHHSSPIMNVSTAFRFSLFDPLLSALFHIPLFFMGFHPVLILMGEVLVQAYQFWIHNEMIGKLGPLEWILNTPSHHRVHHGSDEKYLDKNYGGILIIFDRIFGTFQQEEERPNYGLTKPIETVNPIKIQFFEFPILFRQLARAKSMKERLNRLFKGPEWEPEQ